MQYGRCFLCTEIPHLPQLWLIVGICASLVGCTRCVMPSASFASEDFQFGMDQNAIETFSREKWLSSVVQAIGRPEQWDGLRRKDLTSSAGGFLGPH
jgi:hypothetical protein